MSSAVVLFTRDLRVRDHPALAEAARRADQVVPLFVFDPRLLRGRCGAPNRLACLLHALEDLDRSLRQRGARLVVRRGDPVEEAMRVAATCGAEAIHLSDDVSGYAAGRFRRLEAACARERIELRAFSGVAVVEAGEVLPAEGDHYRVFSPYWRAWRRHPRRAQVRAPRRLVLPSGVRPGSLPSLRSLTPASPSPELASGGEGAARRRLDDWARRRLASYEEKGDDLAAAATSRLSADLHFGCLSPLTVLERVAERRGGETFARQLCWRDFHQQVLAARPDLPHADYRPRGDRWRRGSRDLEAWKEGRTGYPVVDAGMRQLAREGFMHNRARLIVASFLTKTLYRDWRSGAAHFEELLADADVANNRGNWQWVAGTGNDTRPNRVLNPLRQAARFDPDGDYVRRYVPELESLAGGAAHRPWQLGARARRALGYPTPIVDHRQAARDFLGFRGAGRG